VSIARNHFSKLFLLLLLAFAPLGLQAASLAREEASHSKVELFIEGHGFAVGTNWIALEISPREGWHSYWKNPGDSGAAPILEWGPIEGVTFGAAAYPAPTRIPVAHLMNYGYQATSTLLVPVEIAKTVAGQPLQVSLAVEWLVCEAECVPQVVEWEIASEVSRNSDTDPKTAEIFTAARAAMPEPSYWSGNLQMGRTSAELTVYMAPREIEAVNSAYFFPEEDGIAIYAQKQVLVATDEGILLRLPRPGLGIAPKHGSGLLELAFTDGSRQMFALTPMLEPYQPPVSSLPQTGSIGAFPLWQAVLYAFVGGLILNLMPCVFPVLSLKAFAFVSANYKTAANRRREGWAYTLGIWASFMVIVLLLAVLKTGGAAIGWGFQLQEPLFIAFMTLVMVLVALSLIGIFHFSLGGAEGAGQSLAGREGVQGAFFKGVLAALVATPCTAPLMAPAIGFALTQPLMVIVLVFTLLAFGLALPFLLLSYSDALAARMPKPGAWMETVKRVLAVPMLLTAVWLLYVFQLQAGSDAAVILVIVLVLLSFGLWLWPRLNGNKTKAASIAVGVLMVSLFVGYLAEQEPPQPTETSAENAYSEARLAELRREGTPVFVYFTAEWCITCKVNEQVALFRDDVQSAFLEKGVTVLKGDWTNRNDEIARLLAGYGRAGVPLYLYFPAGSEAAIVLPEVLTISAILEVL
jgi:DsbC/DsbD-like thiol-disulfide interchange protein/cytochrome c biogenesis protein CcdA